MRSRLLALLLPLLAPAFACSEHDSLMSDHVASFNEHSDAFHAELDSHEDRIAAADETSLIAAIEEGHFEQTAQHMSGMRHEMADMLSCARSDEAWTHGSVAMHDLESMDEECARHRDAMVAAEDLDAAREEESAHQRTMDAMLESMRSHTDTMMRGSMSMACSHHEG